ncbi:YdcF family protein [cf. Phormidesmis sp. LEGE 11477]|uniref:YdcF family protein n=1 Tax=cf. Phormidesmis sp. LEGE 11477 TaxID=1828680 RepID=UPI00187FF9EA|nr:YdcF family protein [cf. Phormidesmis sp. LEGE 11477]MBE9061132.1 YdcF family protein [cf. Phormidesmis sp. LEGE 11477]
MYTKKAITRALREKGKRKARLSGQSSGQSSSQLRSRTSSRTKGEPGSGRTGRLSGSLLALMWTSVLGVSAIALFCAYSRYQQQFLTPSVALVLGGAPERERFAAQFAKAHPAVEIWISSGSNPEYAQWVFDEAEIPSEQWHLDYQAVDTVTNFTTLVDELEAQNIHEVYLITSDYHMRRASIVAQIVLGSRSIAFKSIEIPTERPPQRPETIVRDVRDGARSLLWVATGKTGSQWRESAER